MYIIVYSFTNYKDHTHLQKERSNILTIQKAHANVGLQYGTLLKHLQHRNFVHNYNIERRNTFTTGKLGTN